MYIWDFSRSVGAGSATTRNTRGLTRSVMRLIVPPLPAVSRPSNTTQTLAPVALTHSCMATSSPCSLAISRLVLLAAHFLAGLLVLSVGALGLFLLLAHHRPPRGVLAEVNHSSGTTRFDATALSPGGSGGSADSLVAGTLAQRATTLSVDRGRNAVYGTKTLGVPGEPRATVEPAPAAGRRGRPSGLGVGADDDGDPRGREPGPEAGARVAAATETEHLPVTLGKPSGG